MSRGAIHGGSRRGPIVIVRAGLAGLTVALHLADRHPVILLAKRGFDEAATAWAQGGIVGVLGGDDSVELHVHDTQDAGAGLVDEHGARFIAEHSGGAVEWLVAQDVPFTTDPTGPRGLHQDQSRRLWRNRGAWRPHPCSTTSPRQPSILLRTSCGSSRIADVTSSWRARPRRSVSSPR